MASPDFAINGGTVNERQSVAASTAITGLIDDIAGVTSVAWEISRVDEGSLPTDYVLVVTGSVDQQVDTTALLAGTAGVLKATINAGQVNDQPSTTTIREVKFFVPAANGLSVLCAGELDSSAAKPDRVDSLTHGAAESVNAAIRVAGGGIAAPGTTTDRGLPSWDGITGTGLRENDNIVYTASGNLAFQTVSSGLEDQNGDLIVGVDGSDDTQLGNDTTANCRVRAATLQEWLIGGAVKLALNSTFFAVTDRLDIGVGSFLAGTAINIPANTGIFTERVASGARRIFEMSGNTIATFGDGLWTFTDLLGTTIRIIAGAVEGVTQTATTIVHNIPALSAWGGAHNVEQPGGNKTLVLADAYHQLIDGEASDRTITLPPEASSDGLGYLLENTGATNALNVEDDAAGSIIDLAIGESARLTCNGTLWVATRLVSSEAAATVEYVSAIQASDLTLTDDVLGNDVNDLTIELGIGNWDVDAVLQWVCGSGSTDGLKTDFTFDGTQTGVARQSVPHQSSGGLVVNPEASGNLTTDHNHVGVSNALMFVRISMSISVSVAGTLVLRAAKNADVGADTIIQNNSSIKGTRQL